MERGLALVLARRAMQVGQGDEAAFMACMAQPRQVASGGGWAGHGGMSGTRSRPVALGRHRGLPVGQHHGADASTPPLAVS